LGWVAFWPPSPSSALPPWHSHDASPKAISGRTSYLPVRLAFHPYPQLLSSFCNRNEFGPPPAVTRASPWPWVAHRVSCLMRATRRPVQTRFRCGSGCPCLSLATRMNSPAHSPRGTRSGRTALRQPLPLPSSVSRRFQVLFHSPHRGSFHLSLTVLVRYRSTKVFSLGGWTPQLPTGLACPVVLRIPARSPRLRLRDCHLVSLAFPEPFGPAQRACYRSFNPASRSWRFGLFRFRSPLLAESFLFLRVLRCFTSPGSLALRRVTLFA
jgi:hypothetical protein